MIEPIGDLKEQDYLDWKHHPVTKLLRAYLHDYGTKLRDDHLNEWINSPALDVGRAGEQRARLLTVIEIETLEFDHIVTHFMERAEAEAKPTDQPQEEPDEGQTNQDGDSAV